MHEVTQTPDGLTDRTEAAVEIAVKLSRQFPTTECPLILDIVRATLVEYDRARSDRVSPGDRPLYPARRCNGCDKLLLLSNLGCDDGCPCNSSRGVNFQPVHCEQCGADDCVKPSHRIADLIDDRRVSAVEGAKGQEPCGHEQHWSCADKTRSALDTFAGSPLTREWWDLWSAHLDELVKLTPQNTFRPTPAPSLDDRSAPVAVPHHWRGMLAEALSAVDALPEGDERKYAQRKIRAVLKASRSMDPASPAVTERSAPVAWPGCFRALAVLVLQSEVYERNADIRDEVDNVLAVTAAAPPAGAVQITDEMVEAARSTYELQTANFCRPSAMRAALKAALIPSRASGGEQNV